MRSLILLLLVLLAGCSTLGKISQLLINPDLELAPASTAPSQLTLHLFASAATPAKPPLPPVRLLLFQLADDSRLLAATQAELQANPEQALGPNYLWHQEYTLVPGQFKTLTLGPLEAQTQYIGAVILGGDPGNHWRQRLRVQATGHDYQILLAWASQTLQLVQDEEE